MCIKTGNPVSSFARWDPAVNPRVPSRISSAPRPPSPFSEEAGAASVSSSSSSEEESYDFVKKSKKKAPVESEDSDSVSAGAAPVLKTAGKRIVTTRQRNEDIKFVFPKKIKKEDDDDDDIIKRRRPAKKLDDDVDSFVVSDEENTPSVAATLEREKFSVGKHCYGCASFDVPNTCAVEECNNLACVLHVCSCRVCKLKFCADHAKPKLHSCFDVKKAGAITSRRKMKEEDEK